MVIQQYFNAGIIQQYVDTIVVNSEKEILWLQRSNNTDFKPGLWCLPGGKLDSTDESVYQGALRELAEETTLMVNYEDYKERPMICFENEDMSMTHYVVANCSKNYSLILDNEEHQGWKWSKLEEINPDVLAFPNIINRINMVLGLNQDYLTNQPLVKSNLLPVGKSQAYNLGLITTKQYLEKGNKPLLVKNSETSELGKYIYVN